MDQPDPYLPRKAAAAETSEHIFPVTERTLRGWSDPPTILVGGRACARRSDWFAAAHRRLIDACHGARQDRRVQLAKARAVRRDSSSPRIEHRP